jgi:hypothetical protein
VTASKPTRTLLFAVVFPEDGIDSEDVDPEDVADLLVEIINEDRDRNWPERGRVNDLMVSGLPPAQWMTDRTLSDLRETIERARERAEGVAD